MTPAERAGRLRTTRHFIHRLELERVDRDIFTVPEAQIRDTKVEATWLAGKSVFTSAR